VTLREEREGRDSRHLWAYLDETGHLHIDEQDLARGRDTDQTARMLNNVLGRTIN
jgi:hypothetical protein